MYQKYVSLQDDREIDRRYGLNLEKVSIDNGIPFSMEPEKNNLTIIKLGAVFYPCIRLDLFSIFLTKS